MIFLYPYNFLRIKIIKYMIEKHRKAIYPSLLASVFIIATCGLLYELMLSSLSSYFWGNSIMQFSITIGLFMFFMGVGSYLSKYFKKDLFETFIIVEIILGFFGGISALALDLVFAYTSYYSLYNFLFISLLGVLIGIEIPIVTRIIVKYNSLKNTVAQVLSFDYIGALAASFIFPLILLPKLGIIKTSFVIGILNLLVSAYNGILFRDIIKRSSLFYSISIALIIAFSFGIMFTDKLENKVEQKIYQDKIIFKTTTKYQHLVLTRWRNDVRLFINGSIQFSSIDEYRYHESLVHLPMMLSEDNEKVLILGGGDGMAVREVLKYKGVKQIDLVDLDPEMTKLGRDNDIFRNLNKDALRNAKVNIINDDAFNFVSNSSQIYSTVIIDLPDPNNTGLGKLYSKEFYEILKKRLSKTGVMVTQATSPYFAPNAYWCIYNTISEVFEYPLAYNISIPSFGIWGFVAAGKNIDYMFSSDTSSVNNVNSAVVKTLEDKIQSMKAEAQFKLLDTNMVQSFFVFKKDMQQRETEINKLNTQKLIEYYSRSANNWR